MYLIVGLGSMGKRRVRCLLANGIKAEEIIGFDRREDRRKEVEEKYLIKTTNNIDDIIGEVDAVFVSTWPNEHIEFCTMAARAGKHWFCEVPLSVNLNGIDKLIRITREKNLIGAVGSQLMFHPAGKLLKEWIRKDVLGGLVCGWGVCTSFFPEWHKWENYKDFYLGDWKKGGANIDMIGHEFQFIKWVLERSIVAVNCRTTRRSNLEFTEGSADSYEMLVEFDDGFILTMHFDGLNRSADRGIWLVGNKTTIHWDLHSPQIKKVDPLINKYHPVGPVEFDYEQCYIEEIGHYLDCLKSGIDWPITLEDGVEVVKLINASHISAKNDGKRITLDKIA